MRNLKKLLALVLAMVMAFSLMLSASAASGDFDKYEDKDQITDEFKEGVQVLTGLDVFKGDERGFAPADTLTRAEAAVIVYRVATGDVSDQQTALYADYNHFADVSKDDWFAGYVGFCQNGGYIKGTTPTTFSPYLKVTGYELLAMLLRVVGYGKNNEFTGSSWQVNTAALAESLHITDTVKEANFASTLNMAARRDVVAELTFQTMTIVPTVTYSSSLQYSDRDSLLAGSTYKNPTLGQKIFGLFMDDTVDAVDEWGRPGYYWVKDGVHATTGVSPNVTRLYDVRTGLPIYTYKTGNAETTANKASLIATIKDEALKVYTARTIECDIAHDLEWTANKTISSAYIDGVKVPATSIVSDGKAQIAPLDTTNYLGGQGRILEIYDMTLGGKRVSSPTGEVETGMRIVEINTYLARVNKVTPAGEDRNGHPTKATIDVIVYPGISAPHNNSNPNVNFSTTNATNAAWAEANWHGVHPNGVGVAECSAGDHTWDFDGIQTEGFTVGQYVLVYVSDADDATSSNVTNGASIAGKDVRAAEIKAGGYVNTWTNCAGTTPDKTTVGQTQYNDADKFCCNWRVTNKPWSVAVDDYGNAIGLVSVVNYLAVEKIEWKQSETLAGGFALADIILADGSKLSSVKVDSLNNVKLTNTGDTDGGLGNKTVSDYYTNNWPYYQHIYTYAINEDGSYALRAEATRSQGGRNAFNTRWFNGPAGNFDDVDHNGFDGTTAPVAGDVVDIRNAVITRGEATIYGNYDNGDPDNTTPGNSDSINRTVATDNTVFAVMNADNYTYTVYTGVKNVPSMTNVNACIQIGENGYAAFVLLTGGTRRFNGSTFYAYVGDTVADTTKYINGTLCNGYYVYKLGDSTATPVFCAPADAATIFAEFDADVNPANGLSAGGNGFYEMTVDENGLLVAATNTENALAGDANLVSKVTDGNSTNSTTLLNAGHQVNATMRTSDDLMDRVTVAGSQVGNSFKGMHYTATAGADITGVNYRNPNGYTVNTTGQTFEKDYRITADTKVIKIMKSDLSNNSFLRMEAGSASDITNGSIAWVVYSTKSTTYPYVTNTYEASVVYVLRVPTDGLTLARRVATTSDVTVTGSSVKVMDDGAAWQPVDGTPDDALAYASANRLQVSLSALALPFRANYTFTLTDGTAATQTYVAMIPAGTALPNTLTAFDGGNTTATVTTVNVGDCLLIGYYYGPGSYAYTVIEFVA